jgi:hypothetical protein
VQLTDDGTTQSRASTQVAPVAGDTVTSANIATAVNAGCVGCHSTAVAVQVLIVSGNPSTFTPGNVAGASNGGCDSCGAYAYARQHWIQTTKGAHLSGEGQLRVAMLRQEISNAAASILPSDAATDPLLTRDFALDALLDGLSAELISTITSDLEAGGYTTSVLLDQTQETTPAS